MNSLEDLVRDALAERAHDVDGLELATFDVRPPTHHRRWVAVGTVAAVAAAILVAIVLVAPWRGSPQRTPATVLAPPAGTQQVSFHGITLTVPDTWKLNPETVCRQPASDSVFVSGEEPLVSSCPVDVGSSAVESQTTTVVSMRELDGEATTGTRQDIDGHAAYRDDDPVAGGRSFYSWPVSTLIRMPDAGVEILVDTSSESNLQHVLDSIEYTPVDHLGCSAQLPMLTDDMASPGRVDFDGVTSAVVCDYPHSDRGVPYLLGSRTLTALELDRLREIFASATPGAAETTALTAPAYGLPVYLLHRADGRRVSVYVDAARSPSSVSDGGSADSTITADQAAQLPHAYP